MSVVRTIEGLGVVSTDKTYCDGTIAQFRGIPYGTVNQRFRRAELASKWPVSVLDGSRFGPVSPTPALAASVNLVGVTLPADEPLPPADEFLCLNLNITTPAHHTQGLPVLVFIHGGANCMGSGSAPQYNGAPLVHLSMSMSQPIVVVTMNFRLGAFGFLASAGLREDNRRTGCEGVGNYGIHDQIVALRWVKKYIDAFGGDPERVTVVGQSAGGSDIQIQMLSRWASCKRLFSQAAIMSGNAVLTTRTLEHQESIYQKLLTQLRISADLPALERVQRLRDVPVSDLLDAYTATGSPLPNWQATVDGFLLDELPRSSTLGSQQYDPYGIIWGSRIARLAWTPIKVQSLLSSHFSSDVAERMLASFGLSEFAAGEAVSRLEPFCTDAEFGRDIHEIANSFGRENAFYYHMRYGNPFPGPFEGQAHHAIDLLFLFQTYNHLLPEALASAAVQMGRHWITFMNGVDPWPPYCDGESVMCYGPESVGVVSKKEDKMGRYERWEEFSGSDEWPRCSMIIRGEIAAKGG